MINDEIILSNLDLLNAHPKNEHFKILKEFNNKHLIKFTSFLLICLEFFHNFKMKRPLNEYNLYLRE